MGCAVRRGGGSLTRFGLGRIGAVVGSGGAAVVAAGGVLQMSGGGFIVTYTDGTSAAFPKGAPIPNPGDPKPGTSTGSTSGSSGSTSATGAVAAGQTYPFQGYTITINSVGSGADSGFHTDNGLYIPIGSTWTIASGAGSGEQWQATGAQQSTNISGQSSGSGSSSSSGGTNTSQTQLVEQISIDAYGNLIWSFDPAAPQPYAIFYDTNNDGNWITLANPAPSSGKLALNLTPGNGYTIVMHAGGVEVARTNYFPAGAGVSSSAVPIDSTTGVPIATSAISSVVGTTTSFFGTLFSSDPSLEWISGIPNWVTGGGGILLGMMLMKKIKL